MFSLDFSFFVYIFIISRDGYKHSVVVFGDLPDSCPFTLIQSKPFYELQLGFIMKLVDV